MKFVIKGYRAACQMFGLQPRESNLSLLSHFSVRSLRSELQYMYVKNVLSLSRKLTRAIVTAAGFS